MNPNGTLKRTYPTGDWVRSSPVISGTRLYVGSNDHKLYAYDIGAGPASGPWPQFHHNARRLGRAIAVTAAPVITTAPLSQTVGLGGGLVLSVAASGTGPLSYQWSENGTPLTGASGATYTVPVATAATAGSYTVAVTGAGGTVTSSPAVITTAAAVPALLTNLSVLTNAGPGAQTLTVGFVLSGTGGKTLLIRGIGPGLIPFGVTGTMANPVLAVIGPNSSTLVAALNVNWGQTLGATTPVTLSTFQSAGAFPLTPGSNDAALLVTLASGAGGAPVNYTAQVNGSPPGLALAEIYDTAIGTGAKLINLSTLAQVPAGGVLTAGFTITGNVAKTVLIRGLGPGLAAAPFSVSGTLANPQLTLYDAHNNPLQFNTGWGATSALITAFTQTGAFSLGTAPTADAAILVTLAPGGYTAQVTGANGTSGFALIEIYEVP